MRNTMKKTALAFGFTAGALALIILLSVLFFSGSGANQKGALDPTIAGVFEEPAGTVDVLLVGDSETYSSLIPLQLFGEYGITSYCCATSGQLLSDTVEILERTFRDQSPKIVVLETNTIFRKVSTSNVMIRKLGAVFSVFTRHDRWKEIGFADNSAVDPNECDTKGYRFSTGVAAVYKDEASARSGSSARIARQNLYYVEEIKSFCDENGATLILVSTPNALNWSGWKHDRLESLADEIGATYIDMNELTEEVPIDWKTDTRDHGDHLNYYGAKKATAYLGRLLWETGLFVDHRDDEAFAAWNAEVEAFYAMVAAAGS